MRQNHALGPADNKALYNVFRKTVEGTVVIDCATGKIQAEKDGKSFVQQALKPHAGCEAWKATESAIRTLLSTRMFTGIGNQYTFVKHANVYRKWNAKIDTASKIDDVVVTVLFQTKKVEYLVKSCDTVTNQGFVTFLEGIKINTGASDKAHDFEEAVATLKPVCPVAKRRKDGGMDEESGTFSGKKRKSVYILSINVKSGKGPKTGVDLRWYPQDNYVKLSKPEKDKLGRWYGTKMGKKAHEEQRKTAGDGQSSQGRDCKKKNVFMTNNMKEAPVEVSHPRSTTY